MKKRLLTTITLALFLFFVSGNIWAQIHVTTTGAGSQNGNNWANAMRGDSTRLQTILDNAPSGAEIWLRTGTYVNTNNVQSALVITKPVKLYGGFNGTETSIAARSNPGITRSTIQGNSSQVTYTTPTPNIPAVNKRGIEITSAVGTGAGNVVLDGLYIYPATNRTSLHGGGVFIADNVQAVLRNLFIEACNGTGSTNNGDGGGVYQASSTGTLTIENVTFARCTGRNGGAIYMGNGNLSLKNVNVENNTATNRGGGIYKGGTGTLTMDRVIVSGNRVSASGGNGQGAGLYLEGTTTTTITTGLIANNAFSNGDHVGLGAGIHKAGTGPLTLINVTVAGNTNAANGAGVYMNGGTLTLRNSILLGNTETSTDLYYPGTAPTYSYVLIGKSNGSTGYHNGSSFSGSYTAADVFDDPAIGDYYPKPGGRAIDGGLNSNFGTAAVVSAARDISGNGGNPRSMTSAGVAGGTIDLGAFEYMPGFLDKWIGEVNGSWIIMANWMRRRAYADKDLNFYFHDNAYNDCVQGADVVIVNMYRTSNTANSGHNKMLTMGGNKTTITGLSTSTINHSQAIINCNNAAGRLIFTGPPSQNILPLNNNTAPHLELRGKAFSLQNNLIVRSSLTLDYDLDLLDRTLSLGGTSVLTTVNSPKGTTNDAGEFIQGTPGGRVNAKGTSQVIIRSGGVDIPLFTKNVASDDYYYVRYLELQGAKARRMTEDLFVNTTLHLAVAGSEIDINGKTLTINGTVSGSGFMVGPSSPSHLIFTDNSNVTLPAQRIKNSTIYNITLQNRAFELGGNLTVNNLLTMGTQNLNLLSRTLTLNGPSVTTGGGKINGTNGTLVLAGSTAGQKMPMLLNDIVNNLTLQNTAAARYVIGSLYTSNSDLTVSNDLTMGAGITGITIPASKMLKVGGTTTTNGAGADAILIQAATGQPNGTFIAKGTNIKGTVEFIPKGITLPANISNPALRTWQYFGIPITTYPAESMGGGTYIRRYMGNTNTPATAIWKNVVNGDDLAPGVGYEITHTNGADKKYTFAGTLNTTNDITHTVEYTKTPVVIGGDTYYGGQWIFSNPYTSAARMGDIVFSANMIKSIWLFNSGEGITARAEGAASGQYTVYPTLTTGSNTSIPSMQGFLVKMSTTSGSGTVRLVNSATSQKNELMRSKGVESEENSQQQVFPFTDIQLLAGSNQEEALLDRAWIYVCEGTTRTFDNGYDGYKMFGAANLSQLYSKESDGNYQVNAVPDMENTLLSFKAEEGVSNYTLRFNHSNMADKYAQIFLTDLQTGTVTDITEDGSTYSFTANNEAAAEQRFLIGVQQKDVDNESDLTTGLEITQLHSNILISNRYDVNATVSVYNISGQLLSQMMVASLSNSSIPESNFATGVYIIKALAEGKKDVTTKVVIK